MDGWKDPELHNGQPAPIFRPTQHGYPPPPQPPPPQNSCNAYTQSSYRHSPPTDIPSRVPWPLLQLQLENPIPQLPPDGKKGHSFNIAQPKPPQEGFLSLQQPSPPPQNHGHVHTPQSQGYSPYKAPVSTMAYKKRSQRALQACNFCRRHKAKCDEQQPCKNCSEKNKECVYKESDLKPQNVALNSIVEAVQNMNSTLNSRLSKISDRFAVIENKIGGLAAALQAIIKVEQSGNEDAASDVWEPSCRSRLIGSQSDFMLRFNNEPQQPEVAPPGIIREYVTNETKQPLIPVFKDDDRPDVPFGSSGPTGAENLLQWPADNLVSHRLKDRGIEDPEGYPRGCLHLYGQMEIPIDFGLIKSALHDTVAQSPFSNNDGGCMYITEAAPYSSQNSAPTPETKATSSNPPGGLGLDTEQLWEHPVILSEELIGQPHGLSSDVSKKRKREDTT